MYIRIPVFLAAVALVGCGDDLALSRSTAIHDVAPPSAPQPFAERSAKVAADAVGAGGAATAPGLSESALQQAVAPSMLIRTGAATIEVDSLEVAIAAVRALAQRVGGYIGNTSMETGNTAVRAATIELKVPAARFDEVLGGLSPIGEVESVTSQAQDVGEEFVDVTARVSNAKRLEERLVSLLANRTGKLEDVLAVERELARVREEIERFDGRLRYLKTRVDVSTLSVTVHEDEPLVGSNPSANVIGDAFIAMWRNFVSFIAALIASLGVVLPLAGIALVLGLLGRRLLKNRRRPHGATPEATSEA
jgi:hypothetical protein